LRYFFSSTLYKISFIFSFKPQQRCQNLVYTEEDTQQNSDAIHGAPSSNSDLPSELKHLVCGVLAQEDHIGYKNTEGMFGILGRIWGSMGARLVGVSPLQKSHGSLSMVRLVAREDIFCTG
jgi:hypothetical protein